MTPLATQVETTPVIAIEPPKPSNIIPLGINVKASILDGIEVYENIPRNRIEALLASSFLITTSISSLTKYGLLHEYENEAHQLNTFLKNYNKKVKAFHVGYKKPRSKMGRVNLKCGLGSTAFSKKTRNALIKDIYVDFDLKNAQPDILRNICISNNIECPKIIKYCNERDTIMKTLADKYSTTPNIIKKLFLRLSFMGAFNSWKEEYNIIGEPDEFINDYINELKIIANAFKRANSTLYKSCEDNKRKKGETDNIIGSFFSIFLQEYEERIVSGVIDYLINNTNLTKLGKTQNHSFIYEYDGIKLLKANVGAFGGVDAVLELFNRITPEVTGFNLTWVEKEITEFHPIDFDFKGKEDEFEGVSSDSEASRKVMELYPHWKYCKSSLDEEGDLFVFDDESGMWCKNEQAIFYKIFEKFPVELSLLTIKDGTTKKTNKSYGTDVQLMNKALLLIKNKCQDNDWFESNINTGLYKLLFKNGYYDFKMKKFFSKAEFGFNPDIIFFDRINHNFEGFDLDYIEDIKQRLFYGALGKEMGDYLILTLARGLAGERMKRILFGLGVSNSGKSILARAVQNACGSYAGGFSGEKLKVVKHENPDSAQDMRWALNVSTKRLIFSNELDQGSHLNGTKIKKISSGVDKVEGRQHYGNEKKFDCHFLPILFANDLPKITPLDDALATRARVINFEKAYVENPQGLYELKADENIREEIETLAFKKAFIGMLIHQYINFYTNEEPLEGVKAKEDWMGIDSGLDEGSDSTVNINLKPFFQDFEVTNSDNDFVKNDDLDDWLQSKKLGITVNKLTIELKKHFSITKATVTKIKKRVGAKTHHVWVGIKRIEEPE